MLTLLSISAAIAVVILSFVLLKRFRTDPIISLNERRRATSQVVSRGDFVDGNRHVPVALAVTPSTFFYENSEMQASLDLAWIREIDYDTNLVTGAHIGSGKVLRLRSDRQTFEFVIPEDAVARWRDAVPPRH
jgi:hypothetical protein